MVGRIEIQFDEQKLSDIKHSLHGINKGLAKVMSRGINKTANSARTEIVRSLAKLVRIKQKAVRKSIRLDKATYSKWVAVVSLTGRRIPLVYFGARQLKKSVKYGINRGETKKIEYNSENSPVFIGKVYGISGNAKTAAMYGETGHRGVFKRLSKKRKPIIELEGPSLPQVFEGAESVANKIVEDSNRKLEDNIYTQVKLLLDKKKAK